MRGRQNDSPCTCLPYISLAFELARVLEQDEVVSLFALPPLQMYPYGVRPRWEAICFWLDHPLAGPFVIKCVCCLDQATPTNYHSPTVPTVPHIDRAHLVKCAEIAYIAVQSLSLSNSSYVTLGMVNDQPLSFAGPVGHTRNLPTPMTSSPMALTGQRQNTSFGRHFQGLKPSITLFQKGANTS